MTRALIGRSIAEGLILRTQIQQCGSFDISNIRLKNSILKRYRILGLFKRVESKIKERKRIGLRVERYYVSDFCHQNITAHFISEKNSSRSDEWCYRRGQVPSFLLCANAFHSPLIK